MMLEINQPEQVKLLSTHLQDSIIRIGDMVFLEAERRFVCAANRFCWESGEKSNQRVLCGFHFDDVEKVRYRGFQQTNKNEFIQLLAICVEDKQEPPAGIIRLFFANEKEIELEVDSVQAYLNDISEMWRAKMRPAHQN